MKNFYIYMVITSLLFSCVDDYEDANPPRRFDGPAPFVSYVGDEIVAADTDDDTYVWVPNGGTARIQISVSDAPGKLNEVGYRLSNSQRPEDWGTVSFEGFDAVKGQETGSFIVVYTAPTLDGDSEFSVALENLTIVVSDAQSPAKSIDVELPAMRTQFSPGSDCFSNENLVGFYRSVNSGYDSIANESFTDLVDTVEVYIRPNGIESPGYYRLSDGSFGLYEVQGGANNFINMEVCGSAVVNADEEFEDNFSGTINDDGTLSITWGSDAKGSGTATMTPIAASEE